MNLLKEGESISQPPLFNEMDYGYCKVRYVSSLNLLI